MATKVFRTADLKNRFWLPLMFPYRTTDPESIARRAKRAMILETMETTWGRCWGDGDATENHLGCASLEIVRLGTPRLGTWRKQTQGFYEKVIWPPMALRIGLLRSSALQNDGQDAPVILRCRTLQETNPKGHWGPNYFFIKYMFCFLPVPRLGTPSLTISWHTQC